MEALFDLAFLPPSPTRSLTRQPLVTISGVVTNYVYDGLNPVQEKNGATVTANLLTGLGIDEFFTRTDGVGVLALLPDALANIRTCTVATFVPETIRKHQSQ